MSSRRVSARAARVPGAFGALLCAVELLSDPGCAAAGPRHQFANLSMAEASVDAAGAAVRGEVLIFAGGKAPAGAPPSGASDSVVVYEANAQAWTFHKAVLSAPRAEMAACASRDGATAFFAGGEANPNKTKHAEVDVLAVDGAGGWAWRTEHLSQARSFLSAAVVTAPNGTSYALFGGGEVVEGVTGSDSARVDIMDVEQGAWVWQGDALSVPRKKLAAAAAGRFVVFGGGYTSGQKNSTSRGYDDTVDIWDSASGAWSVGRLSQARQYIVAAGARDIAIFAGGFCSPCTGQPGTSRSDVADIFDAASGTWTSAVLSQRRSNLAATSVGGRWILIAGGTSDVPNAANLTKQGAAAGDGQGGRAGGGPIVRSNVVDIYDTQTRTWSTARLGAGRCSLGAAGGNVTAAFVGGSAPQAADVFTFAPLAAYR